MEKYASQTKANGQTNIQTLSWRWWRSRSNSRCHWPINRRRGIRGLIHCSPEERVLQSIQRRNSHSLVILEHSQNEVFKLEIVGRRVTSFAKPSAAWTSSVHTDDAVQLPRPRSLVLQAITFS